MTLAEAAELVGRDVNEVHADLTALIKAGVVGREAEGMIFPYEVCCYASDRTSRSLKHCEFMEMP